MACKFLLAGVDVLIHAGARQRHVMVVKARPIRHRDAVWFFVSLVVSRGAPERRHPLGFPRARHDPLRFQQRGGDKQGRGLVCRASPRFRLLFS
jgi:hypothetical protein